MLNSFSLSNFKAFGAEQRIPLRPITLIFGANSSGKSSVLHSLLLAHHALHTAEWDVTHPKLAGDSVELGGFYNFLHRKGSNPGGAVSISFDKMLGTDFQPRSLLLPYAKDLRLTLTVAMKAGPDRAKPALRDCQIDVDGSRLLLLAPKADGQMGINLWETSHPLNERLISWCVNSTKSNAPSTEDRKAVIREIDELNQGATLRENGFLPNDARFQTVDISIPWGPGYEAAKLKSDIHRIYPEAVKDILADLHLIFSQELDRIEYLGPLRSYPSRQLLDNETTDPNWRSGGGFAWQKVKDDALVRAQVNRWLGQETLKSRYEIKVHTYVSEESIRRQLEKSLADHDEELIRDIADKEESISDRINLNGFETRDYVEAHSDLRSLLADYWRDAHQSHLRDDNKDAEADAYSAEEAYDDVLDVVSGDRPFYWEQIREHFLDNNPEIPGIAASFSDPAKAAETISSKIVESATASRSELALIDYRTQTPVTHRDVGIGISQVLPVLVHAFGSRNKLIAIEQPEIHLHPALQAELGDLFIESALGGNGNNFILETHSEHLILRMLRRVRETTEGELEEGKRGLRPSDISVLFVEPKGEASSVVELPVTTDGDFETPWPGGFFAERTRELF